MVDHFCCRGAGRGRAAPAAGDVGGVRRAVRPPPGRRRDRRPTAQSTGPNASSGSPTAIDDGEVVELHAGGGTAATRRPFVLVHGLASNARLWDGVAARTRGRRPPGAWPSTSGATAGPRSPTDGYEPVRHRHRRPPHAHRGHRLRPAGGRRPVVGRQRRDRVRRPLPRVSPRRRLRRRRHHRARRPVPRLGHVRRRAAAAAARRHPARRHRSDDPRLAPRLARVGHRRARWPASRSATTPPSPLADARAAPARAPRAVGAPTRPSGFPRSATRCCSSPRAGCRAERRPQARARRDAEPATVRVEWMDGDHDLHAQHPVQSRRPPPYPDADATTADHHGIGRDRARR